MTLYFYQVVHVDYKHVLIPYMNFVHVGNSKSKVLIFNSNGKSFLNYFMYNWNVIETVNSYCYLGIMLKCNGSFNLAMSTLAKKARKAYFKIKKTID